jgi:hypothetical protein
MDLSSSQKSNTSERFTIAWHLSNHGMEVLMRAQTLTKSFENVLTDHFMMDHGCVSAHLDNIKHMLLVQKCI